MSRLGFGLLFGACAAALSNHTLAQDTGSGSVSTANQGLEEIVVTAQKRSESLQDVPVSITALSGNTLSEQHINEVGDLAGFVPNLQAGTVGNESLPIFSLRGVSMFDYSFNQQGPVATYFDEVYKGSFPLLPLAMFDLERVEVLRGPQGTLYGKNTTGGAINFISRKPGYDTEGYLKLGYGDYERFDADGAVQTGLGEKLAARVAFTYARADGWFENQLPGKPDGDSIEQYGIRASLLFEPREELDFTLRLSTSEETPDSYGVGVEPGPAGVGAGYYELVGGSSYFGTGVGRREHASDYVGNYRHRTWGAALTSNWRVTDDLTITSVTSYDWGKLRVPEDADASPLMVLHDESEGRADQFSQDLRVASEFDGALNFILGAYYNAEKTRGNNSLHYFHDLDLTGDGLVNSDDCLQTYFVACSYRTAYDQTRTSGALYGDVNYRLTESVTLRGGLRYTRDDGEMENYTALLVAADGTPIANTIPGDPNALDASASENIDKGTTTGKIGIDFTTDGGDLLYASYSRGYRGSAFNAQAYFSPDELNAVEPETVDAYEIGFKSQFLDRAVIFNGAAFFYEYSDQQSLNVDSASLQTTLINIPESRIFGAELELAARPTQSLRINAGLGLLDTEIRDGTVSGIVVEGNELPNAPELTLTAGFDWDLLAAGSGVLTLSLNGSYTAKQYFDLFNTDRLAQDGYGLLNGELAYRFADDRYGIAIWGRNLFDEYYYRYSLDLQGFGFDYFRIGQPRTYGITLNARF